MKKCIMKIKKEELIRKSHALELDLPHKTPVDDVRTKVFGVILGKEIGMSKAEKQLCRSVQALCRKEMSVCKMQRGEFHRGAPSVHCREMSHAAERQRLTGRIL